MAVVAAVAAVARPSRSRAASRSRRAARSGRAGAVAARADGTGLVALPGERLARAAGPLTEADLARAEVFTLDDLDDVATDAAAEAAGEDERIDDGGEPASASAPRWSWSWSWPWSRRRGRRRGRCRGRDAVERRARRGRSVPIRGARALDSDIDEEDEDVDVAPPPRSPRTTPFGSVWDSQLGTPAASSAASRAPLVDEEDFDEPEIPEYLIAERRGAAGGRGGSGAGRGPRGGRAAYQSAMERERYGVAVRRVGGGGINRYPDVSGRTRSSLPPRDDRAPVRRDDRPVGSAAQLERAVERRAAGARGAAPGAGRVEAGAEPADGRCPGGVRARRRRDETEATAAATTAKPRATRKPAATATGAKAPAKPRASRKSASTAGAAAVGVADAGDTGSSADASTGSVAKAAAKPRAARKPAAAKTTAAATTSVESAVDADGASAAAPKRRTTRKTATTEPA